MQSVLLLWWLAALLLLLLVQGCDEGTDPGGNKPPTVRFSPSPDSVYLDLDQGQLFSVYVSNASGAAISFRHGDSVLTNESSYLYNARSLGEDSLSVEVVLSDRNVAKSWRIMIELGQAPLPPPVNTLVAVHDSKPGSVRLTWTRPAPSITPRPLTRYHIRVSYGGPLTDHNWEAAEPLAAVASEPGREGYEYGFDDEDYPALHPGEQAWIGIRTEDEAGLFSPVGTVQSIRLTYPYWIEGTVSSDAGIPLGQILVSFGCDTCKTITAADGGFTLGPFRDIDRHVLRISDDGLATPGVGNYYDFRTDTISAETAQPLELMLIANYPLDAGCAGLYTEGGFLEYLMKMTRTMAPTLNRPNRQLLKWANYPLKTYIYEAMSASGHYSLDSLAAVALGEWNDKLDEPIFEIVDQAAGADIELSFVRLQEGYHGKVDVVEPSGYQVNDVIPIRMTARIESDFPDAAIVYVHEVVLHELGHALCLGGHSTCGPGVHVMFTPPAGIIEARWPDNPVSDDEAVTVRCIRNLPQGVSMDQYSFD